MAFVIKDRVKETSTTTGTGTLTLAGAVTGFQSFSAIGNANTTGYGIIAVDADGVPTGAWETGIGTYTSSGTTLSRGLIASSTGSLIDLAAGTKHVICCDIAGYMTPLVMATTANRAIQVADQTALSSSAGNARGSGAVDLQIKRSSASQVASGSASVLSGGTGNTVSSSYAVCGGGSGNTVSTNFSGIFTGKNNEAKTSAYAVVCGGLDNDATGSQSIVCCGDSNVASGNRSFVGGGNVNTASSTSASVVGGTLNTASGYRSVVLGGYGNTASGVYAIAGGTRAKGDKQGQLSFSSGRFAANGDAQWSLLCGRKQTTNNTATEIFLDGSSSRITLSNDTTWLFDISLIVRRTDADGTNSGWTATGVIKRDANAASTALVGACTPVLVAQDAGAALTAFTVTADTTNGSLKLNVTGETSKTYNWVARVRLTEVTG